MGMEALQAALANLRGESDGKVTAGQHGHGDDSDYDPDGLDRTVCYCFSVTERKIRDVVRANDLQTVDDVVHYCKAGGGCGGCRPEIQKILDAMHGEKAEQTQPETAPGHPRKLTNLQKMTLIQQVIEEQIKPGLQADGGDLELLDIDGDRVIVRLKGACAGCPSAHVTLKRWVEAKLRETVTPSLVVEEGTN
jgi:NifU-like protein